jgi:hypothetical protein
MTRSGAIFGALSLTIVCCGLGLAGAEPSAGASTPAADRAAAQAINLRSKDLPGWQQYPDQTSSSDRQLSHELFACIGAPDPSTAAVVHVSSPYFDNGQAGVSSDVTVMRSRSAAQADFVAMRGPKLVPCLDKIAPPYFKAQFPASTKLSAFRVEALRPSWLPPNGYAYRLAMTISAKPKGAGTALKIGVVSDAIDFFTGRAEVDLSTSQEGGGVPNVALEQRLTSLLVTRAGHEAGPTG